MAMSEHEYQRTREQLVDRQVRANNSLIQARTENSANYWRSRRNDLERMIFDLDAQFDAMIRESL